VEISIQLGVADVIADVVQSGKTLEQAGLEVVSAANGLEAVQLAAKERFDGILMDIQMPVMDGLTATREIRKASSVRDLPILAMTANVRVTDREECIAAGMNDHVAKPIKPKLLYETLVRQLRPDAEVNGYSDNEKASGSASQEAAGDLPRLEGIDLQAGLGAVNNDWKLYTRLLYNFYCRHQGLKELIQTELERTNFSVVQRLVHTIKGVAGTLGAKRLSEISSQLESAIKNEGNDRIPNLLDRFATESARVMAGLDAFFKSEDEMRTDKAADGKEIGTPPSKPSETHRLKKLFQELADLIDKRDSDVINLVAEIKTFLGPSRISDNFLELESKTMRFKFEQAKEALEKTTKELDL
jgi:polar amino acid transport system substrate-binding protein